ncbi:MAG: glycosyltransferase family 4 protein [Candidatus Hydrogenedentes bacterium]|nr:glycosyltransferase family 4 protein [Candidatus Hydrogenedentota bacterium]
MGRLRIALDLSCVMEAQLTGVGYAAAYQVRALLARGDEFDFRFVATRPRGGEDALHDVADAFTRRVVLPHAGLIRYFLWSWLDWPPIEWFSGEVDIAHNLSHQVPATRRARRLVTVHDLSVLRVPDTHSARNVRLQTALLRQCARRGDAFIAVSESCRRDLIELLDVAPERIHHVPNGICLDEFDGPLDNEALAALKNRLGVNRDYLIHLGTIEPRKNIPALLDAYSRIRRRRTDYPQLLLVGKPGWLSGPIYEAIEAACVRDARSPAGDVVTAGYLSRRDALTLLRGAVACAYPSRYEGFGLPVLEAMASRVPVITSNVSALPEVVGDTGLLVDPNDVESIEAALAEVLDHPEQARARLDAAERRARTFTWAQSAERLAGVYRRLASEPIN